MHLDHLNEANKAFRCERLIQTPVPLSYAQCPQPLYRLMLAAGSPGLCCWGAILHDSSQFGRCFLRGRGSYNRRCCFCCARLTLPFALVGSCGWLTVPFVSSLECDQSKAFSFSMHRTVTHGGMHLFGNFLFFWLSNLQVAFVTWALFGISEIGNMIEDCPIWCYFVDGGFLPFASLVQGPFPKDNRADSNLWGHFALNTFARNGNVLF